MRNENHECVVNCSVCLCVLFKSPLHTRFQGEYVLLLEGVPSIPAGAGVGIAVGIQWEQALTELLAGGMKPSAAAKTVASWFGVSRKQVYSVALMMVGASWEQDE